jgi:hypothetical protein
MFEAVPWWAWLLAGWLLASVCLTLALARWFRYIR